MSMVIRDNAKRLPVTALELHAYSVCLVTASALATMGVNSGRTVSFGQVVDDALTLWREGLGPGEPEAVAVPTDAARTALTAILDLRGGLGWLDAYHDEPEAKAVFALRAALGGLPEP